MSGARRWLVLLALAGSACSPTVAVRPLTAPGWDGCGVAELQGTMRNVLCPGLDLRLMRAHGFGAPIAFEVSVQCQARPDYDALEAAQGIYRWMAEGWRQAGIPTE